MRQARTTILFPNAGPWPGRVIVSEGKTKWAFVRVVERKEGRFLSLEAHEGLVAHDIAIVPSVCAATTVEDVNELIAALQRAREHL